MLWWFNFISKLYFIFMPEIGCRRVAAAPPRHHIVKCFIKRPYNIVYILCIYAIKWPTYMRVYTCAFMYTWHKDNIIICYIQFSRTKGFHRVHKRNWSVPILASLYEISVVKKYFPNIIDCFSHLSCVIWCDDGTHWKTKPFFGPPQSIWNDADVTFAKYIYVLSSLYRQPISVYKIVCDERGCLCPISAPFIHPSQCILLQQSWKGN